MRNLRIKIQKWWMRTMSEKNKSSKKPRKSRINLPTEFEHHIYPGPSEAAPIQNILDGIELPIDLIKSYKELNEKLEETILRIERKRHSRKKRSK